MIENTEVVASPPAAWRQWLQGRRLWLLVGFTTVAIGLWLGWAWLATIGATGLLVSLLPCLAMCALGLCMRGGKGSCEKQTQSVPERIDPSSSATPDANGMKSSGTVLDARGSEGS